MADADTQWLQRLASYQRALVFLRDAIELANTRPLTELEKQGLIQAFEFVFEMAWNVMKDYFLYQGNPGITGSRDAIRSAFKQELISDGEGWMEMIKSRNQSAHTYNEAVANAIVDSILSSYHRLFEQFASHMQSLAEQP